MTDAAPDPQATGDGAAPRISLGKGRALVPVPPPPPKVDPLSGLGRSHGIVAAGVAAVMGLGFVVGTAVFASKTQPVVVAQAAPPADAATDALIRVQGEVRSLRASLDGLRAAADDGRQADAIRGLKKGVDALRQDLEGAKAASAGAVAQLAAKMDRLDRDPGPKLNEIAARLDRLDREPDAKAAETKAAETKAADAKAADAKIAQVASLLAARIDRVERQMASADATGSVPRGDAATAGVKAPLPPQRAAQPSAAITAVPPGRPEAAKAEAPKPEVVARVEPAPPRLPDAPAKPATVDGWLLRDVYGGVALVEGRAGGLREVAPGEYVPGVGEIRSIERRGRGWVVVTSRGIIQADNRW